MRMVLSRLVIPVLAAALWAPAVSSSLPGQTKTIDVLSTENQGCIGLSFRPIAGAHHYTLKLDARDGCAGCRIDQASAQLVFYPYYSQYGVKFVASKKSERPVIRVRESAQTVLLKGPDERSMRQLFATICSQGGVTLPLNRAIKLEEEESGIVVEFDHGVPVRIAAPAPLSAWVTARDSCGRRAFAIVPINTM